MFIPQVDDMAENSFDEPFRMVSDKCVELVVKGAPVDTVDTDIFKLYISKTSFIKQLSVCLKYINYFSKYFDKYDTLTSAYMILLWTIKNKQTAEKLDLDGFLNHMTAIFTTDQFLNAVKEMVKHNMAGRKLDPPKSRTNESVQITDAHYEAIMFLSIIYKCIIPITSTFYHYFQDKIAIDGTKLTEKNFYYICFSMFINKANEFYDVDLYTKLYHTSTTRTAKTQKEKAMWDRRGDFGFSVTNQQSALMKDLFVDLIQKSVFNKNAIKLIHVSFDRTIKFNLTQKDKHDIIKIDTDEADNDDAPTKFDNLQMAGARFSLQEKSRAEFLIQTTIEELCKTYNIEITDEMISFYKKRFSKSKDKLQGQKVSNDIQIIFIYLFFSKHVGQFAVNNYMKTNWFIKILIIFKTIYRKMGYVWLPMLISGEIDRMNAKRFNKQQLRKHIKNHPDYDELKEEYLFCGQQIDIDRAVDQLRDLIVNKIYIIDHEYMKETEERKSIEVSDNLPAIANEIVRFLLDL